MACIPKARVAELKESLRKGEIKADDIANMLPEEKMALKAILEDVVSDNLGVKVTPEEVTKIRELSSKIDKAQKKVGDDLGNPAKTQENIDFWKAKKAMEDYIMSKSPTPLTRIATGTIGRSAMLLSVKSPVLNIGSNIEVGFTEALSRRLASGNLKGTNAKLVTDYVKMVNKIYQATGYDISRMVDITDTGSMGERVLGEGTVHAQGPGKIRAITRKVADDFVFKQLMGAPDVAFSSAHFADSVNLNAMKMAKGDKTRANEIMLDSMKLEPQTMEGALLKTQGILDAQVATWTNKSWASNVALKLRKVFNDASGNARVGDILFPFIKTPSNVISTGLDYAGAGIPKAMFKTFKAIKAGEIKNPEVLQSITRDLVRAGLGITGAAMIASQLNDDDFVGAYDPSRSQIEQLRNSNYNAIRIGGNNGKWISTDWLGPLAVPVTAIMYARKYGKKGWGERIFQYGKGGGAAVLNLPVISDIYDYVRSSTFKKNQDLKGMAGDTFDYVTSQVYSRIVPSFLSDTAKAFDPYERKTGSGLRSIQAKIPGARNLLPERKNIFGETVLGESPWSEIVFGSRLRTSKETPMINELNRLTEAMDKSITFTDWDKSSSKTLAEFRERVVEEKYNEAKIKYGQELKNKIQSAIDSSDYKAMTDEEKYKLINGLDLKVQNSLVKEPKPFGTPSGGKSKLLNKSPLIPRK